MGLSRVVARERLEAGVEAKVGRFVVWKVEVMLEKEANVLLLVCQCCPRCRGEMWKARCYLVDCEGDAAIESRMED